MNLPFYKLDGAGNDFVGIDMRAKPRISEPDAATLTRIVCNRYHGVGADGVLIIEDARQPGTDFTMFYLNSDGSIGSMCGNGARCMAVFAHHLGAAKSDMRFMTGAGVHRAEIIEGGSRLSLPEVNALPDLRKTLGPARSITEAFFLQVGVPHAVAFVDDLDLLDVAAVGRELRRDPAFAPAGANANFAEEKDGVIHVRTYERGVEAETQACGTGSVATACCFATRKGLTGAQRFTVSPTSGMPLEIEFEMTATGFRKVTLTGPAIIRFRGEFEIDLAAGTMINSTRTR